MPDSIVHSSLALRRIALFDGLDQDGLDRIAAACEWRCIDARQPVFARASSGSDVFFLLTGRVRITTYSANGREVSLRDYQPGEHFGDLAAIDGQVRSADVVALESSQLASLTGARFLQLMAQEPLVARRMLQHLTGLVRQLTDRVLELSTLSVQDRLHVELLRLAHAGGLRPDGSARIAPAPTHSVLASKISTSREQVAREISALAKRGLLRKEGPHILWVTSVQGLQELLAHCP